MKKRIISLLLCLVTIFSLCSVAYGVTIEYEGADGKKVKLNDFLDTKGHWAHDTILKCAEYGLVVGNNGNFMPNQPMSRGQFAVVVDRMLGLKTTSYNLFTDLPNDAYYRDSILKCVAAGYITGVSANQVNPNGYATREQVATIICRIFEIDTSYYGYTSFADDAKISAWAKPSVAAVQRLGYMVGDNAKRFNPQSNITRAEVLTLINNIANTYIPKRDLEDLGNVFKGSFPTNIVAARNISLVNSTVGRDLVLTHGTSSVELTNTKIMGRLLAMNKSTIHLDDCTISQIYLVDGKSSVDGIDKNIREVYICNYASESSLDNYPERLVLEPGTRVRVNGEFYENTTNNTKVYYGVELKADIAAEQGYVVGGAKVSGVKFAQDFDNSLTVSDIKITAGDSKIKEVGVIWLDQENDEDIINPTYQNYDGKTVYKSNKIAEPFGFDVGTVRGHRAYRVYVIDEVGLFAYSDTDVFSEYDFSINMKVLDNDYPKKLDVELIMTGDSIPEIRNVRVVYDRYETYSEEHEQTSMRLYKDDDAEYQPDENKYRRYTATITSDDERDRVSGETIYYPPTAFGYIITFNDGSIINRFPVLTEAIPQGAKPVTTLTLGSIKLSDNDKIMIDNSKVITSYVAVQEVGIVYKESTYEEVASPSSSSVGWERIAGAYDIPSNDSYVFDSTIRISDREKNTFIAPYVKTSGGYFYGEVSKVENDWQADEDGDSIVSVTPYVLGDGEVLFEVVCADEPLNANSYASLGEEIGMVKLSTVELKSKGNISYFVVRGLDKNEFYDIPLRIYKENGSKSNVVSVNFKTEVPFLFTNKKSESGYTYFTFNSSKVLPCTWTINTPKFVNSSEVVRVINETNIRFDSSVNTTNEKVKLKLAYVVTYGSALNITYDFNMTLPLY